jgi:hypothetical protein
MAKTALIAAPVEYSFPLAEWIAFEHAGGDSLAMLQRAHPEKVPSALVIKRWRRDYPAFNLMMVEAEHARAEVLADETISISDNPDIKAGRIGHQVRARQWLASKLHTAKYGNQQAITTTHKGEDSNEAVYSDDELQAIIRAGMKANSIEGEAARIENEAPGTPQVGISTGLEQNDGIDPLTPKIFSEPGKAAIVHIDDVAVASTTNSSGIEEDF